MTDIATAIAGDSRPIAIDVIARNNRPPFIKAQSGTIHDEQTARKHGFSGALVSGIVVGGYAMPVLLDVWGEEWARKGAFAIDFKRPVFDGKVLGIRYDFGKDQGGKTATISYSQDDVAVAAGRAGLPERVPEVDASLLDGDAHPFPEAPIPATPESLAVGQPLGCEPFTLSAETIKLMTNRLDLGPDAWTTSAIHPFVYLSISTMQQYGSLSFPTPGVQVSAGLQMLSSAAVGETVESVGRISKLYEKNGHQYFESEQLIRTLERRPVAIVSNTVIYRKRAMEAEA